jgi:hypothetical protein
MGYLDYSHKPSPETKDHTVLSTVPAEPGWLMAFVEEDYDKYVYGVPIVLWANVKSGGTRPMIPIGISDYDSEPELGIPSKGLILWPGRRLDGGDVKNLILQNAWTPGSDSELEKIASRFEALRKLMASDPIRWADYSSAGSGQSFGSIISGSGRLSSTHGSGSPLA